MKWLLILVAAALTGGISATAVVWQRQRQWQCTPICVLPKRHDGDIVRMAPDFELPTADGKGTIKLSDYRGKKPVALVFGSYTCPFFRRAARDLQRVYEAHGDRVQFFHIYTREAHAIGESPNEENQAEGIFLPKAKTLVERSQRCQESCQKLGLTMPALVDLMDDRVGQAYELIPIRLYLIDVSGQVVFRSEGLLPHNYNPWELDAAIEKLLPPSDETRLADATSGG